MDVLPDDVAADVLGRLDPRSLAACRCVCKPWRATVDGHSLLRIRDLLPLSLAGIFVLYTVDYGCGEFYPPIFFSRPPSSINNPPIAALRQDITGHCNGLLLLHGTVANPATRQSARLPFYPYCEDPWFDEAFFHQRAFLAFDPTTTPVSSQPHFEVFFMHCPYFPLTRFRRERRTTEVDPGNPGSEWPPSPFVMSVFSSRTWRWEERSFLREGMALRSIASVAPFLERVPFRYDAVYWRGRLYVCHIYFIIRLNLEDSKYQVIQLPPIKETCGSIDPYFGKSKKGVYYGFVYGWYKLQVWFLDESTHGKHEWMLKHDSDIDLEPLRGNFPWKYGDGPWSVQGYPVNAEATLEKEEKPEWDSDNDDGITVATAAADNIWKGFRISILGFHPYKEILFLESFDGVIAYHLNSSKAEDLGYLPLDRFEYDYDIQLASSFTYTPCRMEINGLSLEAGVDRALGQL